MPGRYGLWCLALALPMILALCVLAAVQPAPTLVRAAPAVAAGTFPGHYAAPPGRYADRAVPPGGMARWQQRRAEMMRRHMAFRRHVDAWRRPAERDFAAASAPRDVFETGRLLFALALGGGLMALLWAASSALSLPPAVPAGAPLEQDVARLREQVERLQSEQRQLRASLDWQERLLARTGQQGGETAE